MLGQQMEMYDVARMEGAKPRAPTFFTLGKAFTHLRRATPWLDTMPYAPGIISQFTRISLSVPHQVSSPVFPPA